ncbi:histidine kinase dimerization/phospho-acceptor domain-containing protein [Nocardioides sp.]|uniref:histidine kinase dimerization/phospho-acceptor domain-containing protein n=1 Tax=Nocardioides sp. TaxID=35761 RepID=UPI00286E4616|nr:histidine kinase dimerization/phospho-acceptor domain-containing protein [Nocardioides sp.]
MSLRDELVLFAEHAAHDLNNSLAALSMAVELALDVLPDSSDADLSDLLERVQRSTIKLAETVDALPASAEAWPLPDA